jgi:predicted DsbA family dithiol-disulfide isomerase
VRMRYYVDVMSSWCFYCEPNLRRLREKYGDRLAYEWRIAQVVDFPKSRAQVEWFYRRSGSISGMHLNPSWFAKPEPATNANLAAEAAREPGNEDDRVRLALARAALVDGLAIQDRAVAARVAAEAAGMPIDQLMRLMDEPAAAERLAQGEREFAALGVDQRPAFVLRSAIGDVAMFSGVWSFEPLDAAIAAMLSDVSKYGDFAAANPPLPVAQ